MPISFHIKDTTDPKVKAFLEYIKTLDFVHFDKDDIPTWQKEQLDQALDQHKDGTATYKDWNEVRKELFSKYKVQ